MNKNIVIVVQALQITKGQHCTMALDVDTGELIRIRNFDRDKVIRKNQPNLRRWSTIHITNLEKSSKDSRQETWFMTDNTKITDANFGLKKDEYVRALYSKAINFGDLDYFPMYPETKQSIQVLKSTGDNDVQVKCEFISEGFQKAKVNTANTKDPDSWIPPIVIKFRFLNRNGDFVRNVPIDSDYGKSSFNHKSLIYDLKFAIADAMGEYFGVKKTEKYYSYSQLTNLDNLFYGLSNRQPVYRLVEQKVYEQTCLHLPRLFIIGTHQGRFHLWFPSAITKIPYDHILSRYYYYRFNTGEVFSTTYAKSLNEPSFKYIGKNLPLEIVVKKRQELLTKDSLLSLFV